jgi:hypothetical protein
MLRKYDGERIALARTLREALGLDIRSSDIRLHSEEGANKLIFSAPYHSKRIIALALPIFSEYDLHKEYLLLSRLYTDVPEFFPEPLFYAETREKKVMGMELLPHESIRVLKTTTNLNYDEDMQRRLAASIGYALGFTY